MDQIIKINNFTIIFNKTDSETTLVEAYINNGAIYEEKSNVGILVCGSGLGMSMAANRHKKIRAALCYSIKNAKLS